MPVTLATDLDLSQLVAAMGGLQKALSRGVSQNITRLPLANFMPAEGVDFRYHGYITIPNQGVTATVLQFTVPKGYNGMINRLANVFVGGGFNDGSGLITWKLFLDFATAIPAPGSYANITASLGAVNNPAVLNGLRIRENQQVTLQVTNAVAGVVPAGQLIGGLLGGYFYPAALEPLAMAF